MGYAATVEIPEPCATKYWKDEDNHQLAFESLRTCVGADEDVEKWYIVTQNADEMGLGLLQSTMVFPSTIPWSEHAAIGMENATALEVQKSRKLLENEDNHQLAFDVLRITGADKDVKVV